MYAEAPDQSEFPFPIPLSLDPPQAYLPLFPHVCGLTEPTGLL